VKIELHPFALWHFDVPCAVAVLGIFLWEVWRGKQAFFTFNVRTALRLFFLIWLEGGDFLYWFWEWR